MFEKPSVKTDEITENTNSESVVANVGGETNAKTYSTEQMEFAIKDRLTRERKKHDKELLELKAQYEKGTASPNPNVEADFRNRLSIQETEKKQLQEKLTQYQEKTLVAEIEKTLNRNQCLDSEVVIDHFRSKGLVKLDDDGNIVVENVTNSLDDLVKDYLSKKPHLVKSNVAGGIGSKAPKNITPSSATEMSMDEMEAQLGIRRKTKGLFGR